MCNFLREERRTMMAVIAERAVVYLPRVDLFSAAGDGCGRGSGGPTNGEER